MRLSTFAFFTGLSLVACRGSGDDGNNNIDASHHGDTGSGTDAGSGSNAGTVTIQQVQSDSMAPGTAVKLEGVIVTAIDQHSSQKGEFWVEEPAGGPFSGIKIFHAQLSDVAGLAVGDEVTIDGGVKSEFALTGSNGDNSGNTDTEIEPATGGNLVITKTGTGKTVAATNVDALMIGQASTKSECDAMPVSCATNVDWEMYEGVLITVTSTGGGGVIAGGLSGNTGSAADGTKVHFNLTGQLSVESTISGTMSGAGTGSDNGFPAITSGTCLASVTGVLDYFFQYNLLPTQMSDIVTGGTGCPAKEQASGTTAGTCADSVDNDGNGFEDCQDLGCQVGSNAWTDPSNCNHGTNSTCGCSMNIASNGISSIDSGTTSTFVPVILNNVFVTGVTQVIGTSGSQGFWISDSATPADGHGLFVFTGHIIPTVTAGQEISTLQGIVEPFVPGSGSASILEFEDATVGTTTAGTAPLLGVSSTAATAGSITDGASLAGSLVTLTDVKVKSVGTSNQVTLVDNTNATIVMDDTANFGYGVGSGSGSANVPAVGTCYTKLTGEMTLGTAGSAQARTINPRSPTDMVVGAGCTGN